VNLRDEDGELPEVGAWAEKKYELLRHYLVLFSTGMRKKWRTRVYVDLFTGAGKAVVKGTTRIVPTSALIALEVPHPFDRYVLCEQHRKKSDALRARAEKVRGSLDVRFVRGDCNDEIEAILAELPPRGAHDALAVCFADPFALSDLKFQTLRRLAQGRRIDFLVLIPSHMDATRNEALLTRADEKILDEFLGGTEWRARWTARSSEPAAPSFGAFIVSEFSLSMQSLGYLRFDPKDAALVDARNVKLYHLALFSKNPRGGDFWKKARCRFQ
jgi:three-Cys-motif partner protein